jgi:hypothetical protein
MNIWERTLEEEIFEADLKDKLVRLIRSRWGEGKGFSQRQWCMNSQKWELLLRNSDSTWLQQGWEG